MIIPRSEEFHDPYNLVRLMAQHRITAACFVPSLLDAVIEDPAFSQCRALRRVTTGGETLPPQLRNRFLARSLCRLYNGYGPTEATIAATFFACDEDPGDAPVPIGRPIANTQIYIVDADLNPVPVGVPGEICIGGSGLCRGYLNDPQATAQSFVPDPFMGNPGLRLYKTGDWGRYLADGNIQFLGRRDRQVKIRGYRIELYEIERALGRHPGVRQAVVIATERRPGDKRLIAYYAGATDVAAVTPADLRSFLSAQLPSCMVPSAFVWLDSVPCTPNGKIDHEALADDKHLEHAFLSEYTAPRTTLEKMLVSIWEDLLALPRIGVHDDFFESGGHSLMATRLLSRIREKLGIDLELRTIFAHPTIEGLAQFLGSPIACVDIENALRDIEAVSDLEVEAP